MERLTIIGHFKNEEYLLPWWLSHHLQLADQIILIDYRSSDRSREIIASFNADRITVLETKNKNWNPKKTDDEIMKLESGVGGWKLVLQITDFLNLSASTLQEIMGERDVMAWRLQGSMAIDKNPQEAPMVNSGLVAQKPWVIRQAEYSRSFPGQEESSVASASSGPYRKAKDTLLSFLSPLHASRVLSNPSPRNRLFHRLEHGHYLPGRHEWSVEHKTFDHESAIVHFSFSPWTREMLDRKSAIRRSIPTSEIIKGRGLGHLIPFGLQNKVRKFWITHAVNIHESKL